MKLAACLMTVSALFGQIYRPLKTAEVIDNRYFYFLTPQAQPNSGQSSRPKLFVMNREGAVRLLADPPEGEIVGFNIYPQGSRAAFQIVTGTARVSYEVDVITGAVVPVTEIPGFSPNGRYRIDSQGWHDLQTGVTRPMPADARLGDDGSAVYRDLRNLYRTGSDGTVRVVYSQMRNARFESMDAYGRYAVLDQGVGDYLISLATGQEIRFSSSLQSALTMVVSPDGEWVAVAGSGPRVDVCRIADRTCRTIAFNRSERVEPVAIASGGTGVWIQGRGVVYFDLQQSSRHVLLDCATPVVNTLDAVAGSLVRVNLNHVPESLLLNGQPIPWIRPGQDDPSAPMAQIPWEVRSSTIELTLSDHRCPFTAPPSLSLNVRPLAPLGFPPGLIPWSPNLSANNVYGSDWQPIVYPRYAQIGEVLHIYATGLGPVDCPVRTGVAAALDRPCRITTQFDWQWKATDTEGLYKPAEILFAGLAPGMLGIYQIDVRAPEPFPGDPNNWIKLAPGVGAPGFTYVSLVR